LSFLFRRRTGFWLLAVALLGLVAGVFLTRGSGVDPGRVTAPNNADLVDQTPLATARRLALEACSPAEQQHAAQALRVADHAVDQAFATALRAATAQTTPLKGETLAVSQKIAAQEARVEAGKQRVADFTQAQIKAADKSAAAQQVALAQAQLDVDTDQLNDLHQDLVRLGGDTRARIQQAIDEHETIQKQSTSVAITGSATCPESPENLRSLPRKVRALIEVGSRGRDLRRAQAEATKAIADLTQKHEALEKQTETSTAPAGTGQDAINALHALSSQRKTLIEYDARVHDEQQLASIYQSWEQIVAGQKREALHRILVSLAVIAALLLAALVATTLIRRFFLRHAAERRRYGHLRGLAEMAVRLFALGLILIVVFGPPQQLSAIIGLITAGITIVMKDFIIAFLGWFPLMGKNGIRVGDWVEIDGVSGEVVEIGMLRTVLLETGNWADPGHPTGRRTTFMNGFAIEGRYFNFSTSGQWLWDELRVVVPRGENAYNQIEAVRKMVTEATQRDTDVAEREWRKATRDEALRGFSAAPNIDLRPATDGIEVTVRYITRAQKRYEVRSSLYQGVVRILQLESLPQAAGNKDNLTGS
jgi:small-conductance mechanosensitive channel